MVWVILPLGCFSELDVLLSKTDSVRSYLREIGRIPLLSHEQEITYGQQVQQWVKLVKLKATLTTSLEHEPTLAEWATAANLSLMQLQKKIAIGEKAKRQMVEANLRFRFGLNGTSPLTLAQIGILLNMSRERVRQIERDAISKLRKRHVNLSEYLAS